MAGPRKTSTTMSAPRRGGGSSRGGGSRGRGGSRGGGSRGARGGSSRGRGGFTEQSKRPASGPSSGLKHGKKETDDSHDVFEADDGESDSFAKRRRRHVERVDVRDYEIENIDSEDDEEIDSDDAFNDSDEERFESFKRLISGGNKSQATSGKGKGREASEGSDESSSEEDEEEDDEDDLVDLSEMLDASASDDEPSEKPVRGASGLDKQSLISPSMLGFNDLAVGDQESDLESELDSEDDRMLAGMGSDTDASASGDSDGADELDEEEAAERLSKLDGFVASISSRTPRRRFVTETDGGYAEDANTIGSGMHNKGVSLGINDLLGSLSGTVGQEDDEEGGEQQAMRQIRSLKSQVSKLDKAAKKAGAGVVAAPVAKRLQDQMDRTVAYEKTKKAVSEWQTSVNTNRAAEHLSFPMNQPGPTATTIASLVSSGGKTDLEAQIHSILEQSGMTDEQQRQYEELELKAMTPEEARQRQRDLRTMRELMFRGERKAKRMAKIKSKAYRRILKKDKDRAQEKAMAKLKEDDPEMYDMLVEKMARSRAEERITLRHKNTSKWAKEMSKRSHGDEDTHQALRGQLAQHDALKRKIYDIGSGEELSDYEGGKEGGEDSDSDADADMSFAAVKSRVLQKISVEMGADDDVADSGHKALFSMKFMQNAMQRKREAARRDAQMMHDEFESLEADVDEDGRAISLKRPSAANKAAKAETRAPGRMSFGTAAAKLQPQPAVGIDGEGSDEEVSSKRVRLNDAGQIGQVASGGGHRVRLAEPVSVDVMPTATGKGRGDKNAGANAAAATQNPWLVSGTTAQRGGKLDELSKDSTKLDKLSVRLRAKRKDGLTGGARVEENVILDTSKTLSLDKPPVADDSDDDDAMHLEHVGGKKAGGKAVPRHPTAFSQRELVEQAFAEDNIVEAEFAAEKEAAMDEDAPKDVDLTLPGWGSWGGSGVAPKKNKIIQKAAPGSGVQKASRLDAKMGEVIINQRQAKSANKYYASNVPFPFYTPEQYEETLQAPLGKEWNTTKSHSKMIKPRVLTKAGRIIDPLSIPSKKRQ